MLTNFIFQTPNRVIFGVDSIRNLPDEIQKFGRKVLIFHSKSVQIDSKILIRLHEFDTNFLIVNREPNILMLEEFSKIAREFKPDCIVGIGGGSVLDIAKATSAFINNPEILTNYFEIVGIGSAIDFETCPVIAIPTTSGTGSEVTKNAVINFPEKKIKVSLRSDRILPRIALIDPKFTVSLSKQMTAGTGLDALTQLIEAFLSRKANDLTDILCKEGIEKISHSLQNALQNGNDIESRCEMSYASMLSGMALANAGLGAVHGFAGVIGGFSDAPHGFTCARLLPAVFEENYHGIKNHINSEYLLGKMKIISSLLIRRKRLVTIEDGIKCIFEFVEQLNIPRLRDFGISKNDFQEIIDKAKLSSSMKGNPILLTDEALIKILEVSY